MSRSGHRGRPDPVPSDAAGWLPTPIASKLAVMLAAALVLPLLLASSPGETQGHGPYLQMSGIWTSLDGSLTTRQFGAQPVRLDFSRDVGFATSLCFDARAGVVLGRHRLQGGGALFDHTAERSLRDFEFRVWHFDAEAKVENRLRWAEAEYAFAPIDREHGRLELIAGVRWYDYLGVAQGTIHTDTGSHSAEELEEVAGPVPHFGVGGMVRPAGPLILRGALRFFTGGVGHDAGATVDLEASAGARLTPWAELGGGIRRFNVAVNLNDHETDIDLAYTGLAFYVRLGR